MQSFQDIFARAAARHGGEEELEARLPRPKTKRQLGAMADDRYLAAMTKSIFRSGFVWRVVEAKWPGFEEAFHGFDPEAVAALGADEVTELAQDKRIIRNRTKIESVLANAELVLEESARHGGFGRFLAAWPGDDVVGLWLHLRQAGKRLGGDTGPMFLREVGKDTFMLRPDVVAVLVAQGVVAKKPGGKRDLAATQDAFNAWHEESGRPLCQISRVLAMSHGDVYDM
jgi:3-methyladenine DNA glycosylase Tag